MKKHFDIIIIGGGASGLCCAIAAKRKNPAAGVAVIERLDRIGKKLLATGNGRCNLSNTEVCEARYTGSFKDRIPSVLEKYDCGQLLGFFKSLGLLTAIDSAGRVYPLTNQAAAVLDVLRFGCEREGVSLLCGERIKSLRKSNGRFTAVTESSEYSSDKLVIACGSKASPKLGGTASSADYLKNLGHRVVPFSPALCPVKVSSPVIKSLKGIRAKGVASLLRGSAAVTRDTGEIQFAEDALSGICVFNLSLCAKPGDVISLDLLPDAEEATVFELLRERRELFGTQTIDCAGTGLFQKRIMQAVLKLSEVRDFSRACATLTDFELKRIAKTVKAMRFPVTEKAGFEQAQTTLGGVLGSEIDENTMKSKKCGGLSVCGEAIDVCGECGGYNLHFAFASGIIAGENL